MYKLTKLVKAEINLYEEKNIAITSTNQHYHPEVPTILQKYAKQNNFSYHIAQNICASTIENGYLDSYKEKNDNRDMTIFCLSPKMSEQFLDKIWIIPIGFINEMLKQYNYLIAFLGGGLFIGILVLAWRFVNLIIKAKL